VVFRQSCIYGTHQYGIEDQGWVAWFSIAATHGSPLTVFGNGKQVRDVLYVEDLVHAYALAIERIQHVSGEVFNLGGGPSHTLSLLELLDLLERRLGKRIPVSFADWRPGDQRVCIMDIRKAQRQLGWSPQVDVVEGVNRLLDWIKREYRPLSNGPEASTEISSWEEARKQSVGS
jgi:CDP-paratose 2-epimerase